MFVPQVSSIIKFYGLFAMLACVCQSNLQWGGSERHWTLCFGSKIANSSELKYSFEYNELFKGKSFLIRDNGYLIESCGCTVNYTGSSPNKLSIRCSQIENMESKLSEERLDNCPQNLKLYYKETEIKNDTKFHPIQKTSDERIENKSGVCEDTDSPPVLYIWVMVLLVVALLISLAVNLYLNRILKEYLSIK